MKALKYREEKTYVVNDWDDFKLKLQDEGGFIWAHWDGTSETEEKIKEETNATIRCIPLARETEAGKCVYTGKPSSGRVVFAKAY